jgi:protein-disulfide isomerase
MRVAGLRAGARLSAMVVVLGGAAVAAAQPPTRPVNERGPADAPVTVVEFCTYDSEACSRLDIVLEVVLPEFGDRVRQVFRHVSAGDTPAASLRSRAALAAGQQGMFWPMHDILMANRHRATPANIPAMAHQLGLDAARFQTDLDSAETIAAAQADRDEAAAQNVSITPLLIVNGRSVPSIVNAADLRRAINLALAAR